MPWTVCFWFSPPLGSEGAGSLSENPQGFEHMHHNRMSKAKVAGWVPGSPVAQGTSAVTTKQLAPTASRLAGGQPLSPSSNFIYRRDVSFNVPCH